MKKAWKHDGAERVYTHTGAAWYGKTSLMGMDHVDEVCFGFRHKKGGTTGEMYMRWYHSSNSSIVPRLEAWDDSWDALSRFCDVIAGLGALDDQSITPARFCELLDACGFKDVTKAVQP